MTNVSYIKSTKEGRLYIENKDFFKREKVQNLVSRLIKSSIYKNIISKDK